jgi:tetratricopeptide (TPR) repeat protein
MSEISSKPSPEFEARAQMVLSNWRVGAISFTEALERFSALKYETVQDGNLAHEALVERWMGLVRVGRGNSGDALRHFRTAREMYERLGDWHSLLLCNNNIAEVHRQRGELQRAHSLFVMTYVDAEARGFTDIQVFCKANDGRTLYNMGKHAEALITLRQTLQLATQTHVYDTLKSLTALVYTDLSLTYLDMQEFPQALAHAQHALTIGEECKDIRRIAQAQRALGQVLSIYTPSDAAHNSNIDPYYYFKESVRLCREGRFEAELVLGLYRYSESLASGGKHKEAVAHAEEALSIGQRIEMVSELENLRTFLRILQSAASEE